MRRAWAARRKLSVSDDMSVIGAVLSSYGQRVSVG
jgi:hypothetical protein